MVQVSPLLLFVGGLRGWAGDKAFVFCRRSDWLSAPTAPYFYLFLLSLSFPSSLISPVHDTEKDEMRCDVFPNFACSVLRFFCYNGPSRSWARAWSLPSACKLL